jgi:PAS domain S-box-containing protein
MSHFIDLSSESFNAADAETRHQQILAILEYSLDPIYVKDRTLRYRIINPAGAKLVGLRPEDVLGKSDVELLGPEIAQEIQQIDLFVIEIERPFTYTQSRIVDGREQVLQTTKAPFRDHTGEVIGLVGIAHDITQHVLMERSLGESRTQFYQLFELSPDGIFVLSVEEGTILDCNTAAARMHGYQKIELIGGPITRILAQPGHEKSVEFPPDTPILGAIRQEAYVELLREHGGQYQYLAYAQHKSGMIFPVEVSAMLMTVNGREVLVGYNRDRSEYLRAEQGRIERERLQVAFEKERELSDLKSRMMERVSHEFRTPLTIILTSSEMLERYFDRMPPESRVDKWRQIRTMIGHMTEMLDDLNQVVIGEIDSMTFAPHPIDLARLCSDVTQHCRQAFGYTHRFECSVSPGLNPLQADGFLLRLMLTNLLSNAVKYSPANTLIRMTANYHSTTDQVVIQVSDQGIGIREEDRERIFEPFFRGGNFDERPGLGIGLTIVRSAARAHGAQLRIDSVPGKGTTVTLQFPRVLPIERT